MIRYFKLPLRFDIQQLQQDLKTLEAAIWTDHFVQQNYQGSWSALPLRCQHDALDKHPIWAIVSNPGCSEWINHPYLDRCEYFQYVLSQFHCPIECVRLMKLTPGSKIKTHYDDGLSLEDGLVRLHIPVVTNPRVRFMLNNTELYLAEGECWYLRFADDHSVQNFGNDDRIHIVIDAVVNDWLRNLFNTGENNAKS